MAFLRGNGGLDGQASGVNPQSQPLTSLPTGVASELYRTKLELAHTNRTLALLTVIDGLVLRSNNSTSDLAAGISGALLRDSDYSFCAIFVGDALAQSPFLLRGISFSPLADLTSEQLESFKPLKLAVTKRWFGAPELTESIDTASTDQGVFEQTFAGAGAVLDLIKKAKTNTLHLIKLIARKRLVGVLAVGIKEPIAGINPAELEHLSRVGEAVGLALDNALLAEQYQQVLQKLKQSNEKLQELDEAKDDFISMASHQLRTPLTSIKGYLSMLSDGDAGPLNETQKKFIEQSFISSQRMVYLISDLLNVSRLKTGKFIIEPVETYLPDVVEQEVAQLVETAKSRQVELTFVKPQDFPKLILDETKIRQVVMNFIDNAIHYSKNGGHIRAELKVVGGSVQYTVTDDGIGVSKADQPHLFTKFYRGENARKARPDGTGLGLYMGKKAIVASGGALLFKSEEGKGSVFGFSFPLQTPQPASLSS